MFLCQICTSIAEKKYPYKLENFVKNLSADRIFEKIRCFENQIIGLNIQDIKYAHEKTEQQMNR